MGKQPDTWIIDVIVEGGVVQEVLGIPKDTIVRVIDYDTDGAADNETSLITWPYGESTKPERAVVSTWEHDPESTRVTRIESELEHAARTFPLLNVLEGGSKEPRII